MSNKHDGGPAFPQMTGNPTSLVAMLTRGMSLRDWFAGKALAVLTKEVCWLGTRGASDRAQRIADAAYLMADAMLKAREESNDGE